MTIGLVQSRKEAARGIQGRCSGRQIRWPSIVERRPRRKYRGKKAAGRRMRGDLASPTRSRHPLCSRGLGCVDQRCTGSHPTMLAPQSDRYDVGGGRGGVRTAGKTPRLWVFRTWSSASAGARTPRLRVDLGASHGKRKKRKPRANERGVK